MARIIIIGGGFNGRLLQTLMPSARVFDWRSAKPATDNRQLGPQYLWTPLHGLPCRRFRVTTTVDGYPPYGDGIQAYKEKVGKELDGSDWRAQFRSRMDGYEVELPPDRVEYGRRILKIDLTDMQLLLPGGEWVPYDYLISTIPLFALMGLTGSPLPNHEALRYRPIYFTTTPMTWWQKTHPAMWKGGMRVDYVSDPHVAWYRETWRNGSIFRESLLQTPRSFKFVPGKIYAHDKVPAIREHLAYYNVRTFGRFASWAPDELAHETYEQARLWADREGLR